MSLRRVRTIVADASSVNLRSIRRALACISDAELSGTAKDSEGLMDACRSTRPQLLTIDLAMASRDDFRLLEQVHAELPDVVVVITASAADRGLAVRGLSRGAFDIVDLNPSQTDDDILRSALMNGVQEVGRRGGLQSRQEQNAGREDFAIRGEETDPHFDLVLVASSTGGPNALRRMIPQLPGNFPVPILAVQHLPKGYLPGMVKQLNARSAIDVSIATNRMELPQAGWVFARPGWHLEVRPNLLSGKGYYLKETTQEPLHGCRPAADILFDSVAKSFEGRVLSVVMTGMGRDGCAGVESLRDSRQGHCLIQDMDTSVVYGMPRAVEEAGLADEIVRLDELADRMTALVWRSEP